MVHTILPAYAADIASIPSVEDGARGGEGRRVVLREGEAHATVLVPRPQPSVADEPAENEAEFPGPLHRQVQDRRLPVPSNVDVRRGEREPAILREPPLARLNEELVPGHESLNGDPTPCRQELVVPRGGQLESGLRRPAPPAPRPPPPRLPGGPGPAPPSPRAAGGETRPVRPGPPPGGAPPVCHNR